MAITWIYEQEHDLEHEHERCYVQRQDYPDRIAVRTWSNLDQDAMTVHTELEAVQLIQAIDQELESRGWTLFECCPERRQDGDRRSIPRSQPDRRRQDL
jgi:hypothetical protein